MSHRLVRWGRPPAAGVQDFHGLKDRVGQGLGNLQPANEITFGKEVRHGQPPAVVDRQGDAFTAWMSAEATYFSAPLPGNQLLTSSLL